MNILKISRGNLFNYFCLQWMSECENKGNKMQMLRFEQQFYKNHLFQKDCMNEPN